MTEPPASSEALFAALFAKRPQVIKPGLDRIRAGLAAHPVLGAGRPATPSVLVGGTNGKGTTAGFLWQLLAALGVRTGLFTSPHLRHFSERIRVTGARIDDAALATQLATLQRAVPQAVYEPMSFFEVNTLLALQVFAQHSTEVDVMEVGLGGRWDSTNALEPVLSVIASIGLDHQQYLGPTTAHIAFEKAGIMRTGRSVIWGGDVAGDADARRVIEGQAAEKGAHLQALGREFWLTAGEAPTVQVQLEGRAKLSLPLPARIRRLPLFLRENFAKALAAFVWLAGDASTAAARARAGVSTLEGTALLALARFDAGVVPLPPSLRARFELVSVATSQGARPFLLDVCHNVDGVAAFVKALRELGLITARRPFLPGLVAVLADKDYDGILDQLRAVLRPLSLFAVGSERSWSRAMLAARHHELPWHASFAAAEAATTSLGSPWSDSSPPTVVCGSVFALGEAYAALGLDADGP